VTRRKQDRFLQNSIAENVIENGKPLYNSIKGAWHTVQFKNTNPIVLELACGKGEYTVGLAQEYPELNFIGVDIKGDRIARGSQIALRQGLGNVAFLRADIQYLREFFAPGEVSELWVTFPDPQPRDKQEKHRLTHPRFLDLYAEILQSGGLFHLKTDNAPFFAYSLETLPAFGFTDLIYTHNLYDSPLNDIHHGIKTKYEAMFFAKGFSINYLQCKNKGSLAQ
jgi:tRNA (guanine-N7-)-methyltransferase